MMGFDSDLKSPFLSHLSSHSLVNRVHNKISNAFRGLYSFMFLRSLHYKPEAMHGLNISMITGNSFSKALYIHTDRIQG